MVGALPSFEAELLLWSGPAAWVYLIVPDALADEVRVASLMSPRGWGSVRVEAASGELRWRTSLFPDRTSGSYMLPVKAAVRRQLGAGPGDRIGVGLTLIDQSPV